MSFITQYNNSYPMFEPNIKILPIVVKKTQKTTTTPKGKMRSRRQIFSYTKQLDIPRVCTKFQNSISE